MSLAGLAVLTYGVHNVFPVNSTTVGFTYLLFVLVVASTWGFVEASILSIAATLAFNFFFLPPIGTFAIADPQNWVALISFLTISLIASRLSTEAKQRASEAIERQRDVERLYTFSRAILLIGSSEPLAAQLVRKLAEIFQLNAAVLYDRRTGEFHRAGPSDLVGLDDQLRDTALHGTSFSSDRPNTIVTDVRLGSEPIASIALQGVKMPDSVLQGIANLIAIGLERARAQDLAHQIEAARQSEQLRRTLIDSMAHEFKTPLTSIKAATTALLASPDQPPENRMELLNVADEEAEHLEKLIDDTVEMARLDTTHIQIKPELSDILEILNEVLGSFRSKFEGRPLDISTDSTLPAISFDRRLIKLALNQLIDNALKYSPPGTPITIRAGKGKETVALEITDHGEGIPAQEQTRIFERFYRSPSVQHQIAGAGLGLNIAQNIVKAHHGELSVASHPGETRFCLVLPLEQKGGQV
jgi:two-component system sensor histidine kinase KdpD